LFFYRVNSSAQNTSSAAETWADKPQIHKLDDRYYRESAVVVYDKRSVEYFDDAKNEEVLQNYTVHKIIHVNDDRGIESFNKIYLGISENADIIDIRARTITAGGKVLQFDKSNIKDVKEEDGNMYKIFALEGLEKGCEIEYYYTFKRPTSFFGREVIQTNFPVVNAYFQVICPKRLRFDVKTYNFDIAATDTIINDKRIDKIVCKNITGAEEEKYASFAANLQRIEFKLSYNDANGSGARLYTWNELAKRIYSIYTSYTDKELKQATELVVANKWSNLPDEKAKIMAVENYIKTKYAYNENLGSDDANKLETVLQTKTAGAIGILRLYSAVFQNLGINFEFVLTGDRNKFIIDKTFENWNNCDNPLCYFPALNKYIAPTRSDYRFPWIVPSWAGTNGLFCKQTSIGNFSTAIAEVKTIDLENYASTYDNIESKIELTSNLDSLAIDARQLYSGYIAVNFRDAFNFTNDDQKRNIIKELGKSVSGTENIVFSEILNPEFENENTNLPLILHTRSKSGELIEQAGNKLLLKIGLAIGPQVEMYQEKPRQQPVYIEFGNVQERKIDFVIPNGYIIKNPEDLKFKQTYTENGELTMGFVSDYVIKGNLLSIHIMEQYRNTNYPLSQFDQYRKIINTSSDFNKVVLVLEKK